MGSIVGSGAAMLLTLSLAGCALEPSQARRGAAGTLLVIGGGLDDDDRAVYERFLELARESGPARVLIATAATADQQIEVIDKTEALRVWAPDVPVAAILRETSTEDTVAAIDAATAILFTGGDQKRITTRYRPDDRPTPELAAMRRLLARGGVIAGCSAGDAMMGRVMLLSGGSASALGMPVMPAAEVDTPPQSGPRIGPGMNLLPWALTDSHFFERDRVGRLVAALEASHMRLGIGVGEAAAVEIDLASSELTGVSAAESLLIDVAHSRRDGLVYHGILARVIGRGDRVNLLDRIRSMPPAPPAMPTGAPRIVPVVEPGQNRQLASWRLFRHASVPRSGVWRLQLDGWQIDAWAAHDREAVFQVGPLGP